jgi:RNA-directed DNA polymerase
MKTPLLLDKLTQKLRGYYHYFGVIGNLGDLYQVYSHVVELLYKWLNRRSGRNVMVKYFRKNSKPL